MSLIEEDKTIVVREFDKIKDIAKYISSQFPNLKAEAIFPIAIVIYGKL